MRLLRDRSFALLFAGQAVNGIGSWAALVAMWGFAAYHFGSGPAQVAILGLSWALPSALIGPFAGVPVDRLGPKRVLVVAYLAGALTAVAMAFTTSFEQLVALGVVDGLVKAFSQPAANALPPRLVGDHDLLAANALLGAAQESSIVFGPLVAAAAIAAGGLRAAFVVDAITFLAGIAVVAPLRLSTLPARAHERLRTELAEGLRVASTVPTVRFTLAVSTVVFFTWGTFMVVEPIYVRDVLHRPASFFAMLQTAFGVGLVLTGLLLPRLARAVASRRALAASVMLSGVTAAVYVGTRNPAVAMVGVFLWGVDVAFFSAPSRTLLQRHSPAATHGRVLALYGTLHSAGDVVSLSIAGAVAGIVGVQPTAMVAAALAVVVGAYGWRWARRADRVDGAAAAPDAERVSAVDAGEPGEPEPVEVVPAFGG
ncbi:MAG TPA: MFS transporter [Acidimicrobiales bacterium]|nr:MFS transporter [Acidimicrobiales bacterium]